MKSKYVLEHFKKNHAIENWVIAKCRICGTKVLANIAYKHVAICNTVDCMYEGIQKEANENLRSS